MPPTRSKKNSNSRKTRKSNNKKTNKSNNKNASKHVLSVNGIKKRFSELDAGMKEFVNNHKNKPHDLAKHISRQWNTLFKKNLSGKAAATLANHFSKLHNKNKKGGSLAGAPLDHVMRPGLPAVSTYGVFPTEVGASPKALGHLDVYYNSGLGRSCGTENTTATVPSSIGSNLVPAPAKGGRRTLKGKGRRSMMSRKRGGDFMTSLATRQYVSTSPANGSMQMTESAMGQAPWGRDNPDPTRDRKSVV